MKHKICKYNKYIIKLYQYFLCTLHFYKGLLQIYYALLSCTSGN